MHLCYALHKKRESHSEPILCIRKFSNNDNYGDGGQGVFIGDRKGKLQGRFRGVSAGYQGTQGGLRGFEVVSKA